MSIFKQFFVGAGLLLPINLLAQNIDIGDTLQGGFLQTVIINYSNTNTDFYGLRYDGQARTERLLDHIPGMNLISRGNFGQEPVLRGMSSGQINITINHMHIFGACTARMDPVTSYIEPNNMKSLQASSGPGFGNGGATIGGGLNFELRQAKIHALKKWSGSVGTGFETNARARQFLGNIQYSNKRFAFFADGIFSKAGDYTPGGNNGANIARYGQWTKQNGFSVDEKGRVNFSQYQKWNAHASASYQLKTHQTLIADYLQDQVSNVGYPALPMDVAYAKTKMGSLTHEYQNTDKALYYWQSRIYYNNIDHAMDNSKRPVDEIPMQMRMGMTGYSRTGGIYTQLYWKVSPTQIVKTKLETYLNRWHADMTMHPASGGTMYRLMIPDAARTVVGLDVMDEIRLGAIWNITPGFHGEYNRSSVFSSAGKTTLGAIYSENPDKSNWLYNAFVELGYKSVSPWGVDLKLSRGMRAPTLKEMYAFYLYDRVDGYDYIGDPEIKKESSLNSEVNFSYKGKNVEMTLKGFGYFFHNYIAGYVEQGYTSKTPGAMGVKQFENISSAYIMGGSYLFNWGISRKILFISNNTWQWGEDKNNNYLPMIMPFKSVNAIRYSAAKNWRFFIEGIGAAAHNKVSAFYAETGTPGFFIVDASVDKTLTLHSSQIILSLSCNNIFNTYYYESLDVIKLPREGRNFILHATYNF